MNPYEPPQTKPESVPGEATPPKKRKLGENAGCALGMAVIVTLCALFCCWGMWEERNTGPREAYMFEMYLTGACVFGGLSLVTYALLYYYKSRGR